MPQIEAFLKRTSPIMPPVFVSYPDDFPSNQRSGTTGIQVSYTPNKIFPAEFDLVQRFLSKNYPTQNLQTTGVVMVGDDPLLSSSHKELDNYELDHNLSSTKSAPGGGTRSILERVLLIREQEG